MCDKSGPTLLATDESQQHSEVAKEVSMVDQVPWVHPRRCQRHADHRPPTRRSDGGMADSGKGPGDVAERLIDGR